MEKWRIQSCKDLYSILRIDETELNAVLQKKSQYYHSYRKEKHAPKKPNKRNNVTGNNEMRLIHAIQNGSRLQILQKNLYKDYFVKNILFPECVYGFQRERSYEDFLYEHISSDQSRIYLRLDIKDFFNSICYKDLEAALYYYISQDIDEKEKDKILDLLCQITTLNHHVVQGAVTSPLISNLVFRSLDIRILRYCQQLGIRYTRYADDLLFSFKKTDILKYYKHDEGNDEKEERKVIDLNVNRFIRRIANIISEKGFQFNYAKTVRGYGEISLNGFVVGNEVRLARKKKHELNKLLYQCASNPYAQFRNKLAGFRSFYIQLLHYATQAQTQTSLKRKIIKIEKALDAIDQI